MTATSRSNSRRNLLLIAAIAFVPMFIAYGVFFFAPELIPQNTTNRGQLMSPPVDLTGKLPVTEDWQLVLVPRSACANDCTDLIHQTRQIHIARCFLNPGEQLGDHIDTTEEMRTDCTRHRYGHRWKQYGPTWIRPSPPTIHTTP